MPDSTETPLPFWYRGAMLHLRFYYKDERVWLYCTHARHNPTNQPMWRISNNSDSLEQVSEAIQHAIDEHIGGDT